MDKQIGDIVFTQSPPDLDGVACAVAYAELRSLLGRPSFPWCPGAADPEAAFVLGRCTQRIGFVDVTDVLVASRFILVDGSELEAIPREVRPEKIIEVIDHRVHGSPNEYFPNACLDIQPVGAAATIITERFRAKGLMPSTCAGMLLYGAIHSNTQGLHGTVTTERDVGALKWLGRSVSIPGDLLAGQYAARRNWILNDLSDAVRREVKTFGDGADRYIISQLEFEGAMDVIEKQLPDLRVFVRQLGNRAVLNMVDTASCMSAVIVPDGEFRAEVCRRTGLRFKHDVCEQAKIVLRKQIFAAMEGLKWPK